MKNNSLVQKLLRSEIIEEDDVELYQFGIECFLLKTINYASYIIIGMLMKMPMEMLLIGIAFIPLRRSAGGYHAKTRKGCYAFSCVVLLLSLWICKNLSVSGIWYVFMMIANVIIITFAPLDNENKRMDRFEKQYFRRRTYTNLLIIDSVYIITMLFKWKSVSKALIMGTCISAFLLMICKKKGRKDYEEIKKTDY